MAGTAKSAVAAQIATTSQASVASGLQSTDQIVNQAAGTTVNMLETTGVTKPGSTQQVTTLAGQGLKIQKSISSTLTGKLGITKTTTVFEDVGTSALIVGLAVDEATESLKSRGLLTGNESAAQAGGLIAGAVTWGTEAVKQFAETGVATAGLVNSIAGGKFAGGLSDSLTLSGLKTSLGGLAGGVSGKIQVLGSSIDGLSNNLKSGLQNAFSAVEKSFGSLKAGVPNILGPKAAGDEPTQQPSDVARASDAYSASQDEVASAEAALLTAKR
jgi:hypothetical protein